jgi:hypothetical protein
LHKDNKTGKNQLYLPVYDGLKMESEKEQLNVLYSLLLTLGMRESSGGKDNSADPGADYYPKCMSAMRKMRNKNESKRGVNLQECEAGSLQASQNSTIFTKVIYPKFSEQYWQALSSDYENTCRWQAFSEGVLKRIEDPIMENGALKRTNNPYLNFRNLMIGCPMANVEYNAMLLRKTFTHHGPIERFEAPLFGECIDMFAKIHDLIEKNSDAICKSM